LADAPNERLKLLGRSVPRDAYAFEYVLADEDDDWSRKAEAVENDDDDQGHKEKAA
jgi:hypothetical protein